MGYFAQIEIIRRQGLPEIERGFVQWAIDRAVECYVHGTEPRCIVHDFGRDGTEIEIDDSEFTRALLSPVSFAAVVADLCAQLRIDVPAIVERALSGEPGPHAA